MVRIKENDLIEYLIENSKISNVELARKFGVSETAIRKAIKRLKERGYILNYTIEFDHKKLGYDIHVIIGVDTTPEDYLDVIEVLSNNKKVFKLYSSSGDHMLMFESFFRDSRELNKFINQLKKNKSITRICPAIILERIK